MSHSLSRPPSPTLKDNFLTCSFTRLTQPFHFAHSPTHSSLLTIWYDKNIPVSHSLSHPLCRSPSPTLKGTFLTCSFTRLTFPLHFAHSPTHSSLVIAVYLIWLTHTSESLTMSTHSVVHHHQLSKTLFSPVHSLSSLISFTLLTHSLTHSSLVIAVYLIW